MYFCLTLIYLFSKVFKKNFPVIFHYIQVYFALIFTKYFKNHLQFSWQGDGNLESKICPKYNTLVQRKLVKKLVFSLVHYIHFFSVQRYQLAKSRFLFSPPLLPFFWPDWALPTLKFSNRVVYVGLVFCYPKLFWLTVRKNCSSDREKLWKFKAKGQEFAKFLSSIKQFIQTVKGQNNFW